ncbi:MAG TPA: DivIVA domain-containing protein [Nocardioidaceae bacterium]|nr:DivIVA domain-containing protein [Nocardioidaceae bacterium]
MVEPKRGTIDRVMWVWVVVIVALTGAVVAVAVGRGGSMSEAYDDRPDTAIPSGRPLTADDLREVRFSTAVRGYRMDEVDALLARLRADLIARESASPDEEVRVVDSVVDDGSAQHVARAAEPEAAVARPEGVPEGVHASASDESAAEPQSTTGRRIGERPDPPTSHREPTT